MSKKLLVNNIQSESQTNVPLPTINEGLICFLDGRNKGNGRIWSDLSGNKNHVDYSNVIDSRGVIFTDGAICFQKDGDFGATFNNPLRNIKQYTVEVTFRFMGDFIAGVFGIDKIGLALKDEVYIKFGEIYNGEMDLYYANLREKTTITLKLNGNNLFVYSNGVYEFVVYSNEGINNLEEVILGCYKKELAGAKYKDVYGKGGLYIYSLKIYNRALSDEEIAQSYEEEKTIDR